MPSFGVYVAADDPLRREIEKRADRDHDGNWSAYARAAMERDIAGTPDGKSPTILVDLAKAVLGPVLVEDMIAACEGVDQRRELYQLLTRYIADKSEKPKHQRFKS